MPDDKVADPLRVIADIRHANAELQQRLDERTAELQVRTAERDDADAQRAAMAEVMEVINASLGDLMPVFDAMLAKATRLCEASFGILWNFDGEFAIAGALHQVPAAYAELCRAPFRPSPGSGPARMLRGEGTFAI